MHERFVCQIHQVVDHQAVVTFHRDHLAVTRPCRIVVPMKIGDRCNVSQRGIAGPNPDQPMPLSDRKGAHTGRRIERFLAWHMGAATARVEYETVIAAGNYTVIQPSFT